MTQKAARHLQSTRLPPVANHLAAVPSSDLPQLYTIAEAARVLRVPEGWLRKKVTAGVVPHTRLGKHVRFTDDHLCRIVADGEQRPTTPPTQNGQGLSPRARRLGPTDQVDEHTSAGP